MAKENPVDEERRKEKKNKKVKDKEKRSGKDRVHKSRKDKEKQPVAVRDVLEPLSLNLDTEMNGIEHVKKNEEEATVKTLLSIGTLVPFANPLADEKAGKKLLKGVKKCKLSVQFNAGPSSNYCTSCKAQMS